MQERLELGQMCGDAYLLTGTALDYGLTLSSNPGLGSMGSPWKL